MSTYSDDPADIQERSPTEFEIRWKDGHLSVYPYTLLRRACPCARCSDVKRRLGSDRRLLATQVRPDMHPSGWERMGRYALNFVWSDGHSTGIYPYKMLRRVLPL